ncbi:erythromycin esterase family protein [Flavobacterium ardleyense]|uniref:Erythromycin esterase family protein n=1 Tax=Flavobacterium ardleyense TaxID=2038737 RepID=A0ABW5ZAZ8_9FLAO
MKRINFYWIIYFITVACYAQINTISKQDFESSNFQNTVLKNDLKEVRIIGLGEPAHYMGNTFVSKIKLIKYLHEHCDFDVIAFESPMYDLDKYYIEYIKTNKVNANQFLAAGQVSNIWRTDDMIELFKYILETQKTDRPLIYEGFDESLFYNNVNYTIVDDYNTFIKKLNIESDSKIQTDSIFDYALMDTAKKCYYFNKVNPNDTLVLYNTFKQVSNSLDKIKSKDVYFLFWERMTNNIQSIYRKNYHLANRDYEMAKNLSFLANHKYPNKKIMLWGATMHFLEDVNKLYFKDKVNKQSTGYYIKKEFGDKYYHLAFIPAKGVTGMKGYLGLMKRKVKAKKGSIERYILEKYNPYAAFISIRNEPNKTELLENNVSKSLLVGLKQYNVDITSVVDGFFYIKEEKLLQYNILVKYYEDLKAKESHK